MKEKEVCQESFFLKKRADDPPSTYISTKRKFATYFESCIGAQDGTHIPAIVKPELQGPFRNRKEKLTQNVLAVADFDLTFAYALCGWEGSAHDQRVDNDAKGKGKPMFPGKYYLGDAGYTLSFTCLTPYRGVRYHLKEWERGNQRPQNKEELFNLRHSSLRNAIERIFGVIKKRFPILVTILVHLLFHRTHLHIILSL